MPKIHIATSKLPQVSITTILDFKDIISSYEDNTSWLLSP